AAGSTSSAISRTRLISIDPPGVSRKGLPQYGGEYARFHTAALDQRRPGSFDTVRRCRELVDVGGRAAAVGARVARVLHLVELAPILEGSSQAAGEAVGPIHRNRHRRSGVDGLSDLDINRERPAATGYASRLRQREAARVAP